MNYIKELKAFKDWKLLNDLPTGAIALWYTLMSINNMTGWKEWFTAPNSTLQQLTNLSKQGLDDARNKLIQKNLILYRKGNKKQSGSYKILSLVNSLDQLLDQSADQNDDQFDDQNHDHTVGQTADQHLTINKHKLNKTEINNIIPDASDKERKCLSILANVKNYPFDYEKDLAFIRLLAEDFSDLDIQEQLRSWATYKLDNPLAAKSNPRSQIRTWLKNAVKWGKNKPKQKASSGYWHQW